MRWGCYDQSPTLFVSLSSPLNTSIPCISQCYNNPNNSDLVRDHGQNFRYIYSIYFDWKKTLKIAPTWLTTWTLCCSRINHLPFNWHIDVSTHQCTSSLFHLKLVLLEILVWCCGWRSRRSHKWCVPPLMCVHISPFFSHVLANLCALPRHRWTRERISDIV